MFVHFIFLKTTFFRNYSVNYRCPSRRGSFNYKVQHFVEIIHVINGLRI